MLATGTYIQDPQTRLVLDFGDGPFNYRQYLLHNLIRVMIADSEDASCLASLGLDPNPISVWTYLKHPVFLSEVELLDYLEPMYGYVHSRRHKYGRTIYSDLVSLSVDDWLNEGSDAVFAKKWTDYCEDDLCAMLKKEFVKHDPTLLTHLWIMIRNRMRHHFEDILKLRRRLGSLPVEHFLFIVGKFPMFFLHCFRKMTTGASVSRS